MMIDAMHMHGAYLPLIWQVRGLLSVANLWTEVTFSAGPGTAAGTTTWTASSSQYHNHSHGVPFKGACVTVKLSTKNLCCFLYSCCN